MMQLNYLTYENKTKVYKKKVIQYQNFSGLISILMLQEPFLVFYGTFRHENYIYIVQFSYMTLTHKALPCL